MSFLPPYVIADYGSLGQMRLASEAEGDKAIRPIALLGPHGWITHRKQALSFTSLPEAANWLQDVWAHYPALVRGREAVKCIDFPYVPPDDLAGRPVAAEYDPYDEARL